MKKILIILLTTFLAPQAWSDTKTVETTQEGPFNCANAENLAKENLAQQCQNQGMNLKNVFYGACQQTGDDGGYVNYYAVTAQGTCFN
ncbi:hypothetical protein [Bdellovibrio bacteriovorus]|uniref:hypothetical protein n=1 Tax=Bdellovibrio TaxID=958 RepID=UPI0035A90C8F